ncbi:UNVERIFIED_CONTAM: hypothetical protein FKN15_033939 [Acipenser sinensis]
MVPCLWRAGALYGVLPPTAGVPSTTTITGVPHAAVSIATASAATARVPSALLLQEGLAPLPAFPLPTLLLPTFHGWSAPHYYQHCHCQCCHCQSAQCVATAEGPCTTASISTANIAPTNIAMAGVPHITTSIATAPWSCSQGYRLDSKKSGPFIGRHVRQRCNTPHDIRELSVALAEECDVCNLIRSMPCRCSNRINARGAHT